MKSLILLAVLVYASNVNSPDMPPPPGTIRVSKNLYIDKAPITYLDYYEFLTHLSLNTPQLYQSMIPDDTTLTSRGKTMWKNHDFNDSPIVGLTVHQMNSYCAWRSKVVNQLIFDPELRCSEDVYWAKFDEIDPKKAYKVVYSLPTTQDISNVKLKRSSFDEQLADGVWPKSPNNTNRTDTEMIAFRCKATFVPVE